jgi:hypothetical protein
MHSGHRLHALVESIGSGASYSGVKDTVSGPEL